MRIGARSGRTGDGERVGGGYNVRICGRNFRLRRHFHPVRDRHPDLSWLMPDHLATKGYQDGAEANLRVEEGAVTPEEKRKYLDLRKEQGNLKKELEGLTTVVRNVIAALDAEMVKPSSAEQRGNRIAHLCNVLNFQNDQARHFGLGISFKSKKWTAKP